MKRVTALALILILLPAAAAGLGVNEGLTRFVVGYNAYGLLLGAPELPVDTTWRERQDGYGAKANGITFSYRDGKSIGIAATYGEDDAAFLCAACAVLTYVMDGDPETAAVAELLKTYGRLRSGSPVLPFPCGTYGCIMDLMPEQNLITFVVVMG